MQIRPFTGKVNKITELRFIAQVLLILNKEIGFSKTLSFLRDFFKKKNEILRIRFYCMAGVDKKAGQEVLDAVSSQAALYFTLKKHLGNEKALGYYDEIIKKGGAISLRNYMPCQLDSKEPFIHLKELLSNMFNKNKKVKIHDYEIVVSDANAFQLNVTMCILYEILKELGIPEVCISGCQADNVFFEEYLKDTSIKFDRKRTIAKGDSFCDFCFYKEADSKQ